MPLLTEIKDALLHLAFPHVCAGCGTDVLDAGSPLCLQCLDALPRTYFEQHSNNPVEKGFWGRLPLVAATAHSYITKQARMQRLMQAFKYRGHKARGFYLGPATGHSLMHTNRFIQLRRWCRCRCLQRKNAHVATTRPQCYAKA